MHQYKLIFLKKNKEYVQSELKNIDLEAQNDVFSQEIEKSEIKTQERLDSLQDGLKDQAARIRHDLVTDVKDPDVFANLKSKIAQPYNFQLIIGTDLRIEPVGSIIHQTPFLGKSEDLYLDVVITHP